MDNYEYLKASLHSHLHLRKCYLTDNTFAYKYDTKVSYEDCLKCYNFVPVYDKWCLTCNNKNCKLRCIQCESVYFCDKECQKKAWPIHKLHCGRDLFTLCITCGNPDIKSKCSDCPVKFCSEKCKNDIYNAHKDYDCDYFKLTFQ